jgi:16S rRNA (cytidine1402-2'-O)-methyltransferase
VYGDREAAIANDLTKLFERVTRGTLQSLLEEVTSSKRKGEYIVVIAGITRQDRVRQGTPEDEDDIDAIDLLEDEEDTDELLDDDDDTNDRREDNDA